MKTSHIILSFALAFTLVGCDLFSKKENKATAPAPQQMPPAQVDTIIAKKADNTMNFEYPARIESTQDVVLTPKVSGTLIKQKFTPGERVKAGQVLFLIDPDTYEASYEVAQANILQAEANLKNAKNDMERIKKLDAQKATSKREYDNAVAAFESASAALASAKAVAKTAKLNLEYTSIKAPFDGVVSENLIDVGSYVVATNTQLVRISMTDPILARFYIADTANLIRQTNIQNESWAQINSDATLDVSGEKFNGKVNFIDNIVDEKTGSILAKAEFANKEGKLLAGTFAKISMNGFVQKDSFLLPQIAIKQNTTSTYVLVVTDGKVAQKDVKIKYQTSDKAIVTGLEDGDAIIINNFNKIRVGAPVKAEVKEAK